MSDQVPYSKNVPDFSFLTAGQKFADNPEVRCPCVLLLDTSASMQGAPIHELNTGLITLREELVADSVAKKRVELAIITFGGSVSTACEFTTADQFVPPLLSAGGETPMGQAIEFAIDRAESEKQLYRENGVSFYRPWIFMITDGDPTDGDRWKVAAKRVHEGESQKKFLFYCVAVQGANMEILTQISTPERPPHLLAGLKFRELFKWLSNSQSRFSRSSTGTGIELAPTTGWARID